MSDSGEGREGADDRGHELRLPLLGRGPDEELHLPRHVLPVAGILLLLVLALAYILLDPLSALPGPPDLDAVRPRG